MPDKQTSKKLDLKSLEILEAAQVEFLEKGIVQKTRCNVCGSILRINMKGDTAWTIQCDCGKFNDTMRGL